MPGAPKSALGTGWWLKCPCLIASNLVPCHQHQRELIQCHKMGLPDLQSLCVAEILLIRSLGTNFSEILIEIHTFSFTKMHWKMPSWKWRPFCLDLNVLTLFSSIHLWFILYFACLWMADSPINSNNMNPRYFSLAAIALKPQQIPVFLHIAARVWGRWWYPQTSES